MTHEEIAEFIESVVRFQHQVSHDAVNAIADALVPVVNDRLDAAYDAGHTAGELDEREVAAQRAIADSEGVE